MKKSFLMIVAALSFAACNQNYEKASVLDLSNLDTTVSPKVDFYKYAVGGWQAKNPLKPEYARFGTFDALHENNVKRLNDLFADMAQMKAKQGTIEQKISDLYKMGLDSVKLNSDGAAPILKYISKIYDAEDKSQLVKEIADLHRHNESSFFGIYVYADAKNSEMQVLYLGQSGLGLGDRDYYLDAHNKEIKKGYKNFLEKIFTLSGVNNPMKAADNALYVEDKLAQYSWTRVQQRDVEASYNPMSSEELYSKYPGFDFKIYFDELGISDQEKLIVGEPSFFEGFADFFYRTDLAVLKDYMAGQLIQGACGALSDDFYDASFEFFSKQLSGIQQKKPRWKRAMGVPNGILGEAVGKMYVEKYFPSSSKKQMKKLVENLRFALSQHIDSLDWMSDSTKVKAHEKLEGFVVKIGYPDKWKDYSTLKIDPKIYYYENLREASAWYSADNLSGLGKPVDREKWGMTPQTINAYYNPYTNEICFPAAILQPPFFYPNADDAINYGAIGVVIGHEMSHGFDDQGRLFDVNGNMNNWWTDADAAKFKEKADVLVAQFDKIEVLPGLKANGRFTLGENIGDHGGISIAYTALENSLKGKRVPKIDGFTPQQRFFLSYATVWAQNITDESKARLTKLDVHSLAENRVNVSLKNFEAFFNAFDIKEGDPMFLPEKDRVHIW